MLIGYFTNVYPAPSHTTMRREILALEAFGVGVIRIAARPFRGPLIEPADVEEALKTKYLTRQILYAAACLGIVAATRPRRLVMALRDAVQIGAATKSGVWKHLMYLVEACVLLRIARNCSHIHANFSSATSVAIMCRILGGPPVSLRIHGPEEFIEFTPVEWIWKLRHATFVAPISEYGAQRICTLVPPPFHAKIKLLRCGVDSSLLDTVDNSTHSLPAQLRLLCVARLEPRKGHEVLLEALSVLHRDGLSVSVTIIGDGTCRDSLERRARELLRSDAFEFVGWRAGADVVYAMKSARLVVLPSFAEGLPVVLMEALALGRTVVATRVMGIPELVVHGKTGWLVEAGDANSLAAALREALLASDERLLAMGRAGRSMVADRHDVNKLMRDLINRIDESPIVL
jgi:colanic acid/amylovoran biosynthesis glycosyltransferase